jgi:hypothetical protein
MGPSFLEDEDGRTITVTSAPCVEMLENFHTPDQGRHGTELSNIWSQQDGVTAHTARASMKLVRQI